jgi:hypothetical protein
MDKYNIDICALQYIRWPEKRNVIKRITWFYIVDINVTNMNLEQEFILVDILWIIYYIWTF